MSPIPDVDDHMKAVRLARENQELKAKLNHKNEAVAWRVKDFGGEWIIFQDKNRAIHEATVTGACIQELGVIS